MRYLQALIFSGFYIIFAMNFIIPSILADTPNGSQVLNQTAELNPLVPNTSSLQDLYLNSTSEINNQEPEDTAISLIKGTKNDRIYAETNETNSSLDKESISNQTGKNTTVPVMNDSVNTVRQYDSLGDIIKANDWKALSEYKCRLKTENPAAFDNSEISQSDKEARWNARFNPPTPVSYPSCCG